MTFDVDLSQLEGVASQLLEGVDTLDSCRNSLYGEMQTLDGMWQGDAHDAFWASFDQDNQMLVKLFANLRNIAQGAATAKNEYATCEQGVVDTINSVGF